MSNLRSKLRRMFMRKPYLYGGIVPLPCGGEVQSVMGTINSG